MSKDFWNRRQVRGVFVDSFLRNDKYPGAEVLTYEKDLLTGKILSALHPSILTRIEGFEKIESDFDGYFDVAASNVPFGDFAVADPKYATSKEIGYRQAAKSLHNYFFLKGLDQVREGRTDCLYHVAGCDERCFAIYQNGIGKTCRPCGGSATLLTTHSATTPELMLALT